MAKAQYDAVIVGSGPNGLAAGIVLQQKGLKVKIFEEKATAGGGLSTEELTLPGFKHDVCSAVYPLATHTPFFRSIPLERYGLEWIYPEVAYAHPLDDNSAVAAYRSITRTAAEMGADAESWLNFFAPYADRWEEFSEDILAPLHWPHNPMLMLKFGLKGLRSAQGVSNAFFKTKEARAAFAGLAAHSFLPLNKISSSAAGIVLGIAAHVNGWPIPKGGARQIADAMIKYFKDLGGEIAVNHPVRTLKDLPPYRAALFDVTPKQLLAIAGEKLSFFYKKQLQRYKYGAGVFKIDYALSEPVPFANAACRKAVTVHLGGTQEEIIISEDAMYNGRYCDKPFVLFAQPTILDNTRAPAGKHTAWAYCHVPHNSDRDYADEIENQIERFAPGFKDTILARHTITAQGFSSYNSNYIGGDIGGGRQDIRQLFTRPAVKFPPYATSAPDIFICSSSTPPGGGVHGMCGYHAAKTVLRKRF